MASYRQMLIDSSNYYILDVRTKGEYKRNHIPGAVNINYFNFHIARDTDSLDRSKLIFIYCQTCHRSPLASKTLKRKGFRKVYDLRGGFQHWPKTD